MKPSDAFPIVRETKEGDISAIIDLFTESGGNPYEWSTEKWLHYYRDYPDGEPVSLVAERQGRVVGHYGMLPIRLGEFRAMLGLHAYVSSDCRGLAVISSLMEEVDRRCKSSSIDAICGFANENFATVKKAFFKWKIPFWLGFDDRLTAADVIVSGKPFQFHYSDDWFTWRFGLASDYYLSKYRDSTGDIHKQLLKTAPAGFLPSSEILSGCEAWSEKKTFAVKPKDMPSQPFSLKVYNHLLTELGVCEFSNWHIEMGDSDTFIYQPWGR